MARWQIQASIEDGADLEQVASAAEQAGLRVQQKLAAVGLLIGEIDEEHIPSVQAVAGVSAVERTREIRIPPPGSPIQ
jgi:hypothetical protein